MKSVPLTSRGPVDDNNFPWVESQTRSYLSKGEIGFRGLRHEPPHTSPHRRSRTTGSVATPSMYGDREMVVLPKIATGRSAKSAKTMWKDYENIKIKTVLQNELETPRITPLYVPKNPKPLYKRSVDEWKPFDILHFREFAESGEIEPEDVTNCNEFYSQITFLRNAVRNIDGTTSYQNLCKKPRSWSEPSVVDDQPGLIDGNRLHWQSASSSLPHPRMLLPLKPGPTTKWYAWRAAPPNKNNKDKQKSKQKNRIDHHGAFLDAFSPRVAPHPTPAALKVPESTPKSDNSRLRQVPHGGLPSGPAATSTAGGNKMESEGNSTTVEPKGLTFITESKEESVDQAEQRQTGVNVSQETPKDNVEQEQDNTENDEQNVVKNEQSGDALKESGEPQATGDGEDVATSTHQEDTDVATQDGEIENGAEESSPGEEQNNSDDSKSDQNPTNGDENDTHAGEETAEDNEVNDGDQGVSHEPESETDAIDEDILVPDTSIDVSENVELASEDIVQGDRTPDDQNNDQDLLRDGETPGATDQPKGTDEVPEDAEEPQPSEGPDLPGNQDIETGEKSDQPTDDGDQQ